MKIKKILTIMLIIIILATIKSLNLKWEKDQYNRCVNAGNEPKICKIQ